MKTRRFLLAAMTATALTMPFAACSDDDEDAGDGGGQDVTYVWGTDGSIKTCDHLLFTADGKEDNNGNVIGNGDKEFIFNGIAKGSLCAVPKAAPCFLLPPGKRLFMDVLQLDFGNRTHDVGNHFTCCR